MFNLPNLPYSQDALEPFVSSKTISFHYEKHHQGYVNNLNNLIKGTEFEKMSLENIILSTYQNFDKIGIYNNAAQVWNHTFYWNSMKKNGGGEIPKLLKEQIQKDFGSVEIFMEKLKNAASSQFGSGWAWVAWNKGTESGKLEIIKTGNAENPMNFGLTPLLTIDVWEHAYYLDYQNKRVEYIDMFLNKLVNWNFLEENLKNIKK
jgi:Fe-Mn family superoxide dismutase